MNQLLGGLLAVIVAYGIGSIPFGWLVARLAKGIDIRSVGSGNIGATNVARTLGKSWGLLVLLLDVLKGLVPTWFLPWLAAGSANASFRHLQVCCGLAAIVGHMFPCWLGFRGGKGVATALGVVLVLNPPATAIAFAVFAITLGVSRIVSLSSVLAAVSFAGCALWQLRPTPFAPETWSLAGFSLAIPLLIVVRHRANLARLLRGEEPRFGQTVRVGSQEPRDVSAVITEEPAVENE